MLKMPQIQRENILKRPIVAFQYIAFIHVKCFLKEIDFLPLDVDSINENDSVANPDPTPRITSVHKSRFAEVVLVGCWMEAFYYCLLLRKR